MTEELMDLPINEITFPATHNSFNASNDGFSMPNTHWTIEEQLTRGIRCFEIDIHYQQYGLFLHNKRRRIFHSQYTNGILGSTSVDQQFTRLREFLENNPNEIIFLKIEKTISQEDLTAEFNENGLTQYFYNGDGENVPTVREIVESGKQICGTNGVGHDLGWGFVYEGTPTGKERPSEIQTHDAMYDEPSPIQFWTCNTYLETDDIGTGSQNDASYCNNYNWLLDYVTECWKLNGQKTWRLIVDFPSIGDVNGVANTINSYKMLKGTVYVDDEIADAVNWDCQYSLGNDVSTATYGKFNFPVKPEETVTITPQLDGYEFQPSSVSVNFNNFDGESLEIIAIPNGAGLLKTKKTNGNILDANQLINSELKVYPIPAKEKINVILPKECAENVDISLVNTNGQTIKNYGMFQGNSGTLELNLNGLNSGIYVILITGDNYQKSRKIIVS